MFLKVKQFIKKTVSEWSGKIIKIIQKDKTVDVFFEKKKKDKENLKSVNIDML